MRGSVDPGRTGAALLQRGLELRPGRELRHARGGDLDGLAGARMHALAGAALGDAELAEAREVHLAATLQRVLDRLENGIDGLRRLTLAKAGLGGDLIDELGLRHTFLLNTFGKSGGDANSALGRGTPECGPFAAVCGDTGRFLSRMQDFECAFSVMRDQSRKALRAGNHRDFPVSGPGANR